MARVKLGTAVRLELCRSAEKLPEVGDPLTLAFADAGHVKVQQSTALGLVVEAEIPHDNAGGASTLTLIGNWYVEPPSMNRQPPTPEHDADAP